MRRPRICAVSVIAAVGAFAMVGVSPAFASSAWWKLDVSSAPTVLTPGSEAQVVVQASNLGDGATGSAPTTVALTLPSWMEPTATAPGQPTSVYGHAHKVQEMSCSEAESNRFTCTFAESLPAFGDLEMFVTVRIAADAPASAVAVASVEGGETPGVSTQQVFTTGASTPFGLERSELEPESEGGSVDTQAGSHEFQLTSTVGLNQKLLPAKAGKRYVVPGEDSNAREPVGPELAKDLNVKLPPGLIGNANLLPQCDEQQFTSLVKGGVDLCPASTAVGAAIVTFLEPKSIGYQTRAVPVFNLTPSPGEPARFGFVAENAPVTLDTSVRTGSDYGITVSVNNLTEAVSFVKSEVVFWGVPGAAQHDASRGWACIDNAYYPTVQEDGLPETCGNSQVAPEAFLTMPTSCAGALQSGAELDSWEHPGVFAKPTEDPLTNSVGGPLVLNGCNNLGFEPSISVAPDGQQASTPTGLTVGVHLPQEVSLSGNGDAEADMRSTTVTLPAGVQLSASAADGLAACSDAQIGFTGFTELDPTAEPGVRTAQFTPGEQSCPDASKIATVKIKTPLLPNPLEGAVYLASPQNFSGPPQENPFESLIAIYIVAKDPVSGVLAKVPGEVTLDPITGQITTTIDNIPQFPVEETELHFFGGARAPLSTPAYCRDYETTASITPWSTPPGGSSSSSVQRSSTFTVNAGPGGGACTYPGQALPFAPTLHSSMASVNAGNFSPLQTTITREDGQQNIQAVQLHFPPGLSGVLAGVKLCGEAEANAGTCSSASLIGSTVVSVGLGGDPFSVTGGKVYLTEKIAGSPVDAPFGLSIVNPASAGPFVLDEGHPVIVRAQVEINPTTAALTVTTDNSGPYKIPSILDGIPLEIKHVNVTIERAGFTFNPTDCDPQKVTGTVDSTENASSGVSVPFQVTNCQALKFAPKFAVSTPGKTSKAKGAGLHVKLTYPTAAFGSQANIARVKVDLPKQLPSQLKTLQKACPAKTFEEGFEKCLTSSPHSKVGEAVVHTPLLPVPLKGPAIFVSHGGEAFPSLTIVLQGYGVTVDLVGSTFIHGGVTSTTFKTVPDLPFSSFELTLSQGQYAALNTNLPEKDHGNLCGQKLTMPTAFVAQNGAEIHESTKIGVSGCSKAKKSSKKKKHAKAKKRKK